MLKDAMILLAALLWVAPIFAAEEHAPAPVIPSTPTVAAVLAPKPEQLPPALPARERAVLSTAADVALDVAKALSFLEQGQSYFKAYSQGTHNAGENRAFVKFLEDYERELDTVKRELEVLRLWVEKKSALTQKP